MLIDRCSLFAVCCVVYLCVVVCCVTCVLSDGCCLLCVVFSVCFLCVLCVVLGDVARVVFACCLSAV